LAKRREELFSTKSSSTTSIEVNSNSNENGELSIEERVKILEEMIEKLWDKCELNSDRFMDQEKRIIENEYRLKKNDSTSKKILKVVNHISSQLQEVKKDPLSTRKTVHKNVKDPDLSFKQIMEEEKRKKSHTFSYADMLERNAGTSLHATATILQTSLNADKGENISAVDEFLATSAKANRRPRAPRDSTAPREKMKAVYIQGFGSSMTITKIKDHLFNLRFLLSRIRNIRYVGITTVEFLVDESYAAKFTDRFKEYQTHFTIIDDYKLITNPWDDSQNQAERNEKVRKTTQRIYKECRRTNDRYVEDFFKELINSLGPIASKELRKLQTEEMETHTLPNTEQEVLVSTTRQGQLAERHGEASSTKASPPPARKVLSTTKSNDNIYDTFQGIRDFMQRSSSDDSTYQCESSEARSDTNTDDDTNLSDEYENDELSNTDPNEYV
jgi:hypothetical protein